MVGSAICRTLKEKGYGNEKIHCGKVFSPSKNELNYFVNCWVILFSHHQLKMLSRMLHFQKLHLDYLLNKFYFFLSLYLKYENLYEQKLFFLTLNLILVF